MMTHNVTNPDILWDQAESAIRCLYICIQAAFTGESVNASQPQLLKEGGAFPLEALNCHWAKDVCAPWRMRQFLLVLWMDHVTELSASVTYCLINWHQKPYGSFWLRLFLPVYLIAEKGRAKLRHLPSWAMYHSAKVL